MSTVQFESVSSDSSSRAAKLAPEDNELLKKFEKCVLMVQKLPKNGSIQLTNDEKLEYYALYKQAIVGDVDKPKPSFYEVVETAKWNAWKKLKGVPKREAMQRYISSLSEFLKRYPSEPVSISMLKKIESTDTDGGSVNSSPTKLPAESRIEMTSSPAVVLNFDEKLDNINRGGASSSAFSTPTKSPQKFAASGSSSSSNQNNNNNNNSNLSPMTSSTSFTAIPSNNANTNSSGEWTTINEEPSISEVELKKTAETLSKVVTQIENLENLANEIEKSNEEKPSANRSLVTGSSKNWRSKIFLTFFFLMLYLVRKWFLSRK